MKYDDVSCPGFPQEGMLGTALAQAGKQSLDGALGDPKVHSLVNKRRESPGAAGPVGQSTSWKTGARFSKPAITASFWLGVPICAPIVARSAANWSAASPRVWRLNSSFAPRTAPDDPDLREAILAAIGP